MSFVSLLVVGAILSSLSITTALAKNGFLRNGLLRGVAGGSVFFTSSNFLVGYTNLESFISASANGSLGISGFIFLGGLAALIITWVANFVEYGVIIK
jgi:hypothetical protein|tara:strand:- start:4500 stop:4793 length:294 start_codon:yes stop_codon:yes gene_type:complete